MNELINQWVRSSFKHLDYIHSEKGALLFLDKNFIVFQQHLRPSLKSLSLQIKSRAGGNNENRKGNFI